MGKIIRAHTLYQGNKESHEIDGRKHRTGYHGWFGVPHNRLFSVFFTGQLGLADPGTIAVVLETYSTSDFKDVA